MRNEKLEEKRKKGQVKNSGATYSIPRAFKKVAIALATTIVLAVTSFGLTACNDDTKKKEPEIPTKEINLVLDSLADRNYTYNIIENGKETTYLFDETKVKMTAGKNPAIFYDSSNGKSVNYTYSYENDIYEKNNDEAFDIDGVVYDKLKVADWKSYNETSKEISGSMGGDNVKMVIESDGDVKLKGSDYEAEISRVGTTRVSTPENYIDNTIEAEVPVEKINDIIKQMENKNFSSEISGSKINNHYNYLFVGDKRYFSEGNDKNEKITVVEGDKVFEYVLDQNDRKWHKREAESNVDVAKSMIDYLKNAEWSSYDRNTEIITGTLDGKVVTLEIDSDGFNIVGPDYTWKVDDIGVTRFDMPGKDQIVDETVVPELNELYTVENGKIVYNMVAFTEVMTQWIKGDNEFGKDLLLVKQANNSSLNRIIYNDIKPNLYTFGLFYDCNSGFIYTEYKIDDTYLLARLEDGSYKTKADLLTALKAVNIKSFRNAGINKDIEYSTFDEGYETTHKTEFEKLTSQVLEKLKENGVQDMYSNKNGRKEDLTGMNVLFGFKTPTKAIGAGFDMGYYSEWNQYYMIEIDGKYQLLNFYIKSSSTYNPDVVGNVLNGTMGWMISSLIKKDLDAENAAIYQKDKSKSASIERTYTFIADEGEYLSVNEEEWFRLCDEQNEKEREL